jgi:hypothetical protein
MGSLNLFVHSKTNNDQDAYNIAVEFSTERFDGKDWPGYYEYPCLGELISPVREDDGEYLCFAYIDSSGHYHDRQHDADFDNLIESDVLSGGGFVFKMRCRC